MTYGLLFPDQSPNNVHFQRCLYTFVGECFGFLNLYHIFVKKYFWCLVMLKGIWAFIQVPTNIYIYIYIYIYIEREIESYTKARFSSADTIPKPSTGQEPDLVSRTKRLMIYSQTIVNSKSAPKSPPPSLKQLFPKTFPTKITYQLYPYTTGT